MGRDICRICGKKESRQFYTLLRYPLTAGPVSSNNTKFALGDLVLGYCFNCGTCTVINSVVNNIKYDSDYTSSNMSYGLSRSMDKATWQFMDFINACGINSKSKVLEIGSYDGSFMSMLRDRHGCSIVGCEPCLEVARIAQERGFKVFVGDFKPEAFGGDRFDIVIMRNVLEHVLFPVRFMIDVSKILNLGGVVILEVPNGEMRIADGILGSVVPEHPCYFGVDSLYNLLGCVFGLPFVERGMGVLTAVVPKRRELESVQVKMMQRGRMVHNNRQLVEGEKVIQKRKDTLHNILSSVGKVSIYGANTCTLELLSGGFIAEEQVVSIFDDDPRKFGKYMVNTNIQIRSSGELKNEAPNSTVLVSSYRHMATIVEKLEQERIRPFKLIRLYPGVEMRDYG